MIQVRKANDRGHFDHGWLNTYHTFSFAGYHDSEQMRFRDLRVMNEDWVAPGQGFGKHSHRDMEIVTYVLEGALEHQDSMGNGETLRPGEFQRMSAGSGILHSEFNPSTSDPVHLYQIWLYPAEKGIEPSYEQKSFPAEDRQNRLQLVASPDAAEGSLQIHQDARIYLAEIEKGSSVEHAIPADRHVWLQVLRGSVDLNGTLLETSDGAAISQEAALKITAADRAEVMLFEMN
ncbi:pirin family protein [Blastopirellula retiformator]|uniref:Quercetin 2,3-dioxygenase n=1 Tax=Blastopirellula retiformator TaxID=2527970 RepID=A0A5C5VN95_9BACT|nr:pirin family protein [Blastopirellula retiformator]TWT39375.1 Quercetin 2,3-dioxygenase [Blastopirellula retiformator]